jgi:hypothetical protein
MPHLITHITSLRESWACPTLNCKNARLSDKHRHCPQLQAADTMPQQIDCQSRTRPNPNLRCTSCSAPVSTAHLHTPVCTAPPSVLHVLPTCHCRHHQLPTDPLLKHLWRTASTQFANRHCSALVGIAVGLLPATHRPFGKVAVNSMPGAAAIGALLSPTHTPLRPSLLP